MLGQRIKELIENKGLNKAEFARKIGMSPQSLNGLFKRQSIETKNLVKIAETLQCPVADFFPDDAHAQLPQNKTEFLPIFMNNEKEGVIPILNKKAAAGFPSHVNDVDYLQDLPYISHPHFTDAQYLCIQVRGDSMVPTLQESDYVIARLIDDPLQIRDGQIYVVVLEDGVLIKRVEAAANGLDSYTLLSDNPDYEPSTYPAEEIKQFWGVKLRMTADFSQQNDQVNSRLEALERALQELKSQV